VRSGVAVGGVPAVGWSVCTGFFEVGKWLGLVRGEEREARDPLGEEEWRSAVVR
jgi:hypothetical protein